MAATALTSSTVRSTSSLPGDMEPEALSLELAVELITARTEKVAAKKAKKKMSKKSNGKN